MSSNHEIGGSTKIRVVNKSSRGVKIYLIENPCFTYKIYCFPTTIAFFTKIHRELCPD